MPKIKKFILLSDAMSGLKAGQYHELLELSEAKGILVSNRTG